MSTGSSPPTAKEMILNYFFGQNGPGPISSDCAAKNTSNIVIPIGRDTSGPDMGMSSGLLTGKHTFDSGTNAALDMKSLGKHIKALPSSSDHSSSSINPCQLSIHEEMEVNLIQNLISSYFSIV